MIPALPPSPPAIYCAAETTALINLEVITDCMAMHESGKVDRTMGRKGELGRYQFDYATWRIYTDAPFDQAMDYPTAHRVALVHAEYLARKLAPMADSPESLIYLIAAGWVSGAESVAHGFIGPNAIAEGEAVVQLYFDALNLKLPLRKAIPRPKSKEPML